MNHKRVLFSVLSFWFALSMSSIVHAHNKYPKSAGTASDEKVSTESNNNAPNNGGDNNSDKGSSGDDSQKNYFNPTDVFGSVGLGVAAGAPQPYSIGVVGSLNRGDEEVGARLMILGQSNSPTDTNPAPGVAATISAHALRDGCFDKKDDLCVAPVLNGQGTLDSNGNLTAVGVGTVNLFFHNGNFVVSGGVGLGAFYSDQIGTGDTVAQKQDFEGFALNGSVAYISKGGDIVLGLDASYIGLAGATPDDWQTRSAGIASAHASYLLTPHLVASMTADMPFAEVRNPGALDWTPNGNVPSTSNPPSEGLQANPDLMLSLKYTDSAGADPQVGSRSLGDAEQAPERH